MRWRRTPARRGRPESGSTLIEVLMAVVIMGIAFVVVLGGMATAIIGAGVQHEQASASLVIRNAAEAVKDPDVTPYQVGATTYPMPAPPPGFTVAIDDSPAGTGVTCLDAAGDAYGTPCTAGDTGVQLVKLIVSPTSLLHNAGPQRLQVVKRKP